MEYPKIQTLFDRDPGKRLRYVIDGQFSKPEFEYLKNCKWVFSEKVDGVNIRVIWNGKTLDFKGKTDKTEIPKYLVDTLTNRCELDKFMLAFGDTPTTVYGECYGAKIQGGGSDYIPYGQDFIVFDIMVKNLWLHTTDVIEKTRELGLKYVPFVGSGVLKDGVRMVKKRFVSHMRDTLPEGIVFRPLEPLLNRKGERVISKLKLRDYEI